jgi:hypothetical protein
MRLIGVYNANGGLIGELSYFFAHMLDQDRRCTSTLAFRPPRKK